MSVLTLAGKPIDWAKPPKPTAKVLWSRRTEGGKKVTGSLRTIAQLDRLDSLAVAKFGVHIVVIQPPYNVGVEASAGTHNLDVAKDVKIPGVPWADQQTFFREHGEGAYHRTRAQGFSDHIHMFTLPPKVNHDVSRGYQLGGFKVGYLIDGGWSTKGRAIASSQIADYYAHKDALASHRHDPSWFPANIDATIFDLGDYIAEHQAKLGPTVTFASNNVMSLPPNKHVDETMADTPTASLVALQEVDIFHTEAQSVPGYKCIPIPKGDIYDSTIIYKPKVWRLEAHAYYDLYDGVKGISKTRKIAVARFTHLETGQQVIVISYHDVTRGEDSVRLRLRRKARSNVRTVIRRHQKLGQPILIGTDTNQLGTVYRTASVIAKHGIDHIYAWAGKHVSWTLLATRAVPTASDHDAWIVRLLMKVK